MWVVAWGGWVGKEKPDKKCMELKPFHNFHRFVFRMTLIWALVNTGAEIKQASSAPPQATIISSLYCVDGSLFQWPLSDPLVILLHAYTKNLKIDA